MEVRRLLPLLLVVAAAAPHGVSAVPEFIAKASAFGKKTPSLFEQVKAQLEAKKAVLNELHGVRGSNKLEEETRASRPSGPKNFPFLEKRSAADNVSSSVRARALLDADDVEYKWSEASSDCKKTMEKVGYKTLHLAAVDSASTRPPRPVPDPEEDSVYKGCVDLIRLALKSAYGRGDSSFYDYDYNDDIDAEFCNKCTDTSWMHEFGNTCGMDMVMHYWSLARKYLKNYDDGGSGTLSLLLETDPKKIAEYHFGLQMAEEALEMLYATSLVDYYGVAGVVACFTDADGNACAEQTSSYSWDSYSGYSSSIPSWWDMVRRSQYNFPEVDDYESDRSDDWEYACPPNATTGYIDTGCTSRDAYYYNTGDCGRYSDTDSCCYMASRSLRNAWDNHIMMCSVKDVYYEISATLGGEMASCQQDFHDATCNRPSRFVDGRTDQMIECCQEKESATLTPACNKGGNSPGDAIEEYLNTAVGRNLLFESSAGSVVLASTLAVLAAVLLGSVHVAGLA